MQTQRKLQLFESVHIRSHWDAELEEWFFSVVDVVAALTDSENPTDYLKKLRKRDEQLGEYVGTNCPQVAMPSASGKSRKSLAATTQQLFRIIQAIPSQRAEPFKLWLAEVGNQRLDQLQDPELSIEQAMVDYKRLGYSDNWINQRLKSIEIRKELTDEWKKHGLQEGAEFAFLTDVIYKTWTGKTAKEYKQLKGLKKENLRDNMTNKELVMNMLAELSTKEISEAVQPQTLDDHEDVAKRGGGVAKEARLKLEAETGKPVVTSQNAKQLRLLSQGKSNKQKGSTEE